MFSAGLPPHARHSGAGPAPQATGPNPESQHGSLRRAKHSGIPGSHYSGFAAFARPGMTKAVTFCRPLLSDGLCQGRDDEEAEMMTDVFRLDRYLARIGFGGSVAPDLATLTAIH